VFETPAFRRVVGDNIYELRQVFRQSDQEFVSILNTLRRGQVTDTIIRRLQSCMIDPRQRNTNNSEDEDSSIAPTYLFPHRNSVENENLRKLQDLKGDPVTYQASDEGTEPYLSNLKQNCPAPEKLSLKIGAQVILLKNIDFDRELVNGSRGVIEAFTPPDKDGGSWPVVRFSRGRMEVIRPLSFSYELGGQQMATRTQLPLNLAWALSIHKSQGMTIDRLVIKLDEAFEYGMSFALLVVFPLHFFHSSSFTTGQAYVALSRATSLEGMKLLGFNPRTIKAHPKVIQFYNQLTSFYEEQNQRNPT
jgi:ATP-dependent DNA helicase PIF1